MVKENSSISLRGSVLVWLLLVTQPVWVLAGQNNQEIFLRAQKLMEQREYKQAIDLYEILENKGEAVWVAMAQAAVFLHDYDHAYIYLLRAEKEASWFSVWGIEDSITSIKKQLGLPTQKSLFEWVWSACVLVSRMMPLWIWQTLFLCILYILIFMMYMSYGRLYKVFFAFLLGSVLVGIIARYYDQTRRAVVFNDTVIVHAGMHEQFSKRATLKKFDIIALVRESSDWYYIEHPVKGWIRKSDVELL
jgi:hypothetical protein